MGNNTIIIVCYVLQVLEEYPEVLYVRNAIGDMGMIPASYVRKTSKELPIVHVDPPPAPVEEDDEPDLFKKHPKLKTETEVGWGESGSEGNFDMLCEMLKENLLPTQSLDLSST